MTESSDLWALTGEYLSASIATDPALLRREGIGAEQDQQNPYGGRVDHTRRPYSMRSLVTVAPV